MGTYGLYAVNPGYDGTLCPGDADELAHEVEEAYGPLSASATAEEGIEAILPDLTAAMTSYLTSCKPRLHPGATSAPSFLPDDVTVSMPGGGSGVLFEIPDGADPGAGGDGLDAIGAIWAPDHGALVGFGGGGER